MSFRLGLSQKHLKVKKPVRKRIDIQSPQKQGDGDVVVTDIEATHIDTKHLVSTRKDVLT